MILFAEFKRGETILSNKVKLYIFGSQRMNDKLYRTLIYFFFFLTYSATNNLIFNCYKIAKSII